MKIVILLSCLLFIGESLLAQEPHAKLSPDEEFWNQTFDDSTRALARLFIIKRTKFKPKVNKAIINGGASLVIITGGVLLLASPSIIGPVGALMYVSGLVYFITEGVLFAVRYSRFHPYTKRKFDRLIERYKNGESFPPFYKHEFDPYILPAL